MEVTKHFLSAFFLLTIILSCTNSTTNVKQNSKTDKNQKNDSSKYINIVSLTPYLDTINYSKFTISYTGKLGSFEAGIPVYHIDTFSQNNEKYRLLYKMEDSENEATLEKFTNGQWFRRIEFYKFNGSGTITHSIDVNNDGFKDILREARFFQEIYLFNPLINNFIDKSCGNLNNNVYLIDSLHNIFCDFQEYRQHCNTIFSSLYTFKNFRKYYLFKLDLDNCKNGDYSKIEKMTLSKCLNGELDQTEKLKTYNLKKQLNPEKEKYFDNKKFWTKEYKTLLGYS